MLHYERQAWAAGFQKVAGVDELVEVRIPDRPGALARVADRLGGAGINIHYGYVGTARSASQVSLVLSVDAPAAALRVLRGR